MLRSTAGTGLDAEMPVQQTEHDKRLHEAEDAFQKKIESLQGQHEQRTTSLQTRQAELQDELVRLRTDLGEEMQAREALSEQNREYEEKLREQDDQADLIAALHADMAQEKDRATDLGVRLQEALLEVDSVKSSEQSLKGQLQAVQEERSRSNTSLSEAQIKSQDLESQLSGLEAELEAVSKQLISACADRDAALRNQSAEAERTMRDHIAEADGDRAVLEHQNLTLQKQLEDLKVDMEVKVAAAKNAAVRQADSLTAELRFTKAQLRDCQRRETVLTDELAMAKDTLTASSQKEAHLGEATKDAVALAVKYHDCNQQLMTALTASATINASLSLTKPKPHRIDGGDLTEKATEPDEMNESVLLRSLATATAFDLESFSEAVMKLLDLIKKFTRKAKQYRDEAKNKIAFSNFSNGDLVRLHIYDIVENKLTGYNRPCSCLRVTRPHVLGLPSTVSLMSGES